MAKSVGFTRLVKLPWMDKAMELAASGLTTEEMKDELDEYLSFEIDSETNRHKTREILINLWGRDNGLTEKLRGDAIALAEVHPDIKIAVHWGMLMAAFPVFTDITRLIGKMFNFQDEITTGQVINKVLDEWGERTTVQRSVKQIVASLCRFGVTTRVKHGRYIKAEPIVLDEELSRYLIYADMLMNHTSYRTFLELQDTAELFPFECHLSKEGFVADERFEVSNFGGEFSVGVRE